MTYSTGWLVSFLQLRHDAIGIDLEFVVHQNDTFVGDQRRRVARHIIVVNDVDRPHLHEFLLGGRQPSVCGATKPPETSMAAQRRPFYGTSRQYISKAPELRFFAR